MVNVVCPEPSAEEPLEQVVVFVGALGALEHCQTVGAVFVTDPLKLLGRKI